MLPQSSATPANDTDLVTKTYVDTQIAGIDTSNLAKLNEANTFGDTADFISQANFYNGASIGKLSSGGLHIQTADNSITINLDDSATLTLNSKMISELKRILGIS